MNLTSLLADHRGRRLRFPAGVAIVLAAGAGLAFGGSKPSTADLQTGPITVEARPIAGFDRQKHEETRFGKLTWRGGCLLTFSSNSSTSLSVMAPANSLGSVMVTARR